MPSISKKVIVKKKIEKDDSHMARARTDGPINFSYFIRNAKRGRFGILKCFIDRGTIRIGWSLCNKADKFIKSRGEKMADGRMLSGSPEYHFEWFDHLPDIIRDNMKTQIFPRINKILKNMESSDPTMFNKTLKMNKTLMKVIKTENK